MSPVLACEPISLVALAVLSGSASGGGQRGLGSPDELEGSRLAPDRRPFCPDPQTHGQCDVPFRVVKHRTRT